MRDTIFLSNKIFIMFCFLKPELFYFPIPILDLRAITFKFELFSFLLVNLFT